MTSDWPVTRTAKLGTEILSPNLSWKTSVLSRFRAAAVCVFPPINGMRLTAYDVTNHVIINRYIDWMVSFTCDVITSTCFASCFVMNSLRRKWSCASSLHETTASLVLSRASNSNCVTISLTKSITSLQRSIRILPLASSAKARSIWCPQGRSQLMPINSGRHTQR